MNRRDFLLSAGAVAAAPVLGGQSQEASRQLRFTNRALETGPFSVAASQKRPNIVLISADMVSPDLYHPDRSFSKNVRIPSIRSLMEDGSFFSNAFCTVPLCSPSRASYLTGRYSYIQGNGEHAPVGLETELRPDDIIFPEYLRASGYICRQVGKCHVGAKKFLDAFGENDQPWDQWSPPVRQDDDYLAYLRRLGVKPQKYAREIVFKQQDRKIPGNSAGGWIVQNDGRPFPLEAHYSYYLGQKAIDAIENLIEKPSDQRRPFYAQLDIFDPHQPFSIPGGFEERERELRRTMTLPASYFAAKKMDWKRSNVEPDIIDIYRKYWGIYDDNKLLEYRVAYVLQMELVDRVIGNVLAHLKKRGLYDEAMIAFISDHGEMNGRHALIDKGVFHYPDTLRVPLILKPQKGTEIGSNIVNEPVTLMDLSQTVLDAAGIRAEAKFDGVSLLKAITGDPLPDNRDLLFFAGWHVGVNFACGIQHRFADGRQFLYTYNLTSPVDGLFDMKSEDAVNLIDDSQYGSIRDQMIRMLGKALQADPRWSGYWTEFRLARFNFLPSQAAGDMQMVATAD